MTWQTVIGLEVHAQLKTRSKLFSSASTTYGGLPNTQTNFIDAGFPGVLPVLNQKAIIMAIQFGLAIQATINDLSFFERKNYFYPDLPKGYQISQFQSPIVAHGQLDLGNGRIVHIERAHLEEDAGKSIHDAHLHYTGIDLNRAGTPLLEIVTTPCIFSAQDAVLYLKTLHQLLQFLVICDGNMQEGSFRCDVNLSIRPKNSSKLGTRTELKNLNSFRFIEKAIHYEAQRHQDMLERGEHLTQETRLYCPQTNTTKPLRSKENENDYRYFPDPDLLPIQITNQMKASVAKSIPELPSEIKQRLLNQDKLNNETIEFLLTSPATIQFYDAIKQQSHAQPTTIVNWLKGTYTAALKNLGLSFENPPISPKNISYLLDLITDKVISTQIGKEVFEQLLADNHLSIDQLITSIKNKQTNDDDLLHKTIQNIIHQYPKQVAEYQAGKEKLLGFFVGMIMKAMKGNVEAAYISTLLRKILRKSC